MVFNIMKSLAEDVAIDPLGAGGVIGVASAALGDRQDRSPALLRRTFRTRAVGPGEPAPIERRSGARVLVRVPPAARS
jgi:hypothetical protein